MKKGKQTLERGQAANKFAICLISPSFRYASFRLLLEKLNKSRNGV